MDHARFGSKRLIAAACATTLLATLVLLGSGLPAQAQADKAKPAPSAGSPVDINRATADELMALPGIGPAMARRIVAFRDENGPFRRVEDLMKVKGIGEKSFQKLRPAIKVSKTD